MKRPSAPVSWSGQPASRHSRRVAMRASSPRHAIAGLTDNGAGEGETMAVWYVVLAALIVAALVVSARREETIPQGSVGLLIRDGAIARRLEPGRHVYFDVFRRNSVVRLPLGDYPVPLGDTTVLSSDQFSFRVTLVLIVALEDPAAYHTASVRVGPEAAFPMPFPIVPTLAPRVQAALVEEAARHTLDEIVADPRVVHGGVAGRVADALPGLRLVDVLVVQLVLPPEVRKMFTEVERARREGLASLERARAEQASLRALANAARALKANPGLAQLRLIQTMESAKGNKTFVLGSLAGEGCDIVDADWAGEVPKA